MLLDERSICGIHQIIELADVPVNGPFAGVRSIASPPAFRAVYNWTVVIGCIARLEDDPVVLLIYVIATKRLSVKVSLNSFTLRLDTLTVLFANIHLQYHLNDVDHDAAETE